MSNAIEMTHIRRLFMILHGMYGNQLLDKWRTGQTNAEGQDMGLLSAQKLWLERLKTFDWDTILRAVAQCERKYKTFPPSEPEFRELCCACAPLRPVPNVPRLTESDESKAARRAANRRMLAELKLAGADRVDYGQGLPALLLLVSKAVGAAGGDEVKTLLALEARFTPNARALRH